MIPVFGAVTGWALFAALVTSLGSLAARWLYIPRAAASSEALAGDLDATAGKLGFGGALALSFAMSLVLLRQLIDFRDPFATWSEDAELLLSTDWGRTWATMALVSVVSVAAFLLVRFGVRFGWWLATATVVALTTYPALSGHASGTGDLRPLTLTADILHVLAAGAWIGGLAFVLYAERRWRTSGAPDPASLLPTLVPVFSPFAVGAVALLLLTGLTSSWVHLEGPGALVSTPYGRLLSLKVGIVTLVLYLGAVNWRRLKPQLTTDGGPEALRRNASMELLISQIVLVVTAILVRTAPLGH